MVEREVKTAIQPRVGLAAAFENLLEGEVRRSITTVSGRNGVIVVIHKDGEAVNMVEVHYFREETVTRGGKTSTVATKGYVAPIKPEVIVNPDPSAPDKVESMVIKGQKEEVTIVRGGDVTVQKLAQPKAADGDGVISNDI